MTRITGLSGIDTESLIKKLMDAESMRLNTMNQARQRLVWRQESYRNVTSSLKNFQNTMLSLTTNVNNSIRSSANFKSLTPTVTNSAGVASTAVSVTAGSKAATGDYELKVHQVAKADIFQSASKVNTDIVLKDIDFANITTGDTFNFSLDGSANREISFGAGEIAAFNTGSAAADKSAFAAALNTKLAAFGNDPGGQKVTAAYDAVSGNVKISTTPGHTVRLADGARPNSAITGNLINYDAIGPQVNASYDITINGETKNISFTFSTIYEEGGTTVDKAAMNSAFLMGFNAALSAEGLNSNVAVSIVDDKLSFSNLQPGNALTVSETGDAVFGISGDVTLSPRSSVNLLGAASGATNVLDISKSVYELFGDDMFSSGGDTVEFTIGSSSFTIHKDDRLSEVMRRVNESNAGVRLSFDAGNSVFRLESTRLGAVNGLTFSDDDGSFFAALGLNNSAVSLAQGRVSTAQDAIITLNGVTTTRETNNFTFLDLNIALTDKSEGGTFNINLAKNSEGAVNLVRNFVTEYNKMIDAMNAEFKVQRPKADNYSYYEPLTDAQKKAMTEKEVVDWEKNARTGLNYNDSIISGISSQLRDMLYQSVTMEDGTKLSLFEIGVTTSSAAGEAGKIVFDEAKFVAAFEKNSDHVASLFTKSSSIPYSDRANRNARLRDEGIAERINDIINFAISSGGSLYQRAGIEDTASKSNNDMFRLIKAQEDKIFDFRRYLAKKENEYYMMFSKLEAAVISANNQMSSLFGMLGM